MKKNFFKIKNDKNKSSLKHKILLMFGLAPECC